MLFWGYFCYQFLLTLVISSLKFTLHNFFSNGSYLDGKRLIICEALGDLVSFVQFKKLEKHPWRNVTFSKSKVASEKTTTILKVRLFHACFSRF